MSPADAVSYDPYMGVSAGRLQIRFKLIPHGLLTRQRKMPSQAHLRKAEADTETELLSVNNWFRLFHDIAGYSGVSRNIGRALSYDIYFGF